MYQLIQFTTPSIIFGMDTITFVQLYEERFEKPDGFWRPYLQKVIYRYLDCGYYSTALPFEIKECGQGYPLAFSCKRYCFQLFDLIHTVRLR